MTDSPNGAEIVGRPHANPSFRKQVARLRPALWFILAFGAVYLLPVWTGIGQSAEDALIVGREVSHARAVATRAPLQANGQLVASTSS